MAVRYISSSGVIYTVSDPRRYRKNPSEVLITINHTGPGVFGCDVIGAEELQDFVEKKRLVKMSD